MEFELKTWVMLDFLPSVILGISVISLMSSAFIVWLVWDGFV